MESAWPDVCRHLAKTYPETRQGSADAIELIVPLEARGFWNRAASEAAQAGLGSQPVEVSRVDAWLRIASPIGSARHLSPLEILANNLHLAVGVFCLVDGALAMRHTLPLPGLRFADLDDAIRAVAHQSARARRHLSDVGSAPPGDF